MKSNDRTKRLVGAAAAPLLFWLLVVCGLAGLTLMRMDSVLGSDVPGDVLPLWIGSIGGVAIGQLLAHLRVRMWILGVVSLGASWFLAPFLFFLFNGTMRGDLATFVIAFAPAAVCGYFSLSERGSLLAFWYPTVLWMLVILDGPSPGALDARGALPFMLGLAALFVAFLFAKQTRRLAIWRTHGSVRLATPISRTVLRASPVRTASQLAWTGIVGGAALMLSAWIAPHLWAKEHAKNAALASSGAVGGVSAGESHCCAESVHRARVREYFPLGKGYIEHEASQSRCVPCDSYSSGSAAYGSAPVHGGESYFPSWYSAQPNSGIPNPYYGAPGGTYGGAAAAPAPPPHVVEAAPGGPAKTAPASSEVSSTPSSPEVHAPTHQGSAPLHSPAATTVAPSPPTSVGAPPKPANVPAAKSPSPASAPSTPSAVPSKAVAPLEAGSPWRSLFAFCAGGVLLHFSARALRRKLTLRHLARPFWSEPLDQRISNHWQRMLVGLRDAGIHPARDEQPRAFALRVGIDGMETCATILERVRHGVRVESTDLDTMSAAANEVYRAARSRAGATGRAAAWLRWPLA